MIRLLSVCTTALLLSACVNMPLSSEITARSNGKGHVSIEGGGTLAIDNYNGELSGGLANVHARASIGVTDNFDIGVLAESTKLAGLWARYSFLNQDQGLSFAMAASVGAHQNGISDVIYAYLAPIVSYKTGVFEPFLSARINYSHTENNTIFEPSDALSGLVAIGSTFWIGGDTLGITASANAIIESYVVAPYLNVGINLRF